MASYERRRWDPQSDLIGIASRAQKGCDYEAYIPDMLERREFLLNARVAADVNEAELAIARLEQRADALVSTEALARLLLRAESVASSRIEGLEVGAARLLRADTIEQLGEAPNDLTASEVLGNIRAMENALKAVTEAKTITVDQLLAAHKQLLERSRLSALSGTLRTAQNWIGGSEYNPCSAEFVPPPPEFVEDLVKDTCAFCNDDSLPPVAQAAIAHAQFETIHPFGDGNGRVGRVLIHMILRRRGLTTTINPPVSLVLATMAKDYVAGLTSTRYVGAADSLGAITGYGEWISTFARACTRAVQDADDFEDRVEDIQADWRRRIGGTRADSAAELLIRQLAGVPVISVASAAQLIGRSVQAVNEAVARLESAKILAPRTIGKKRSRVFEAREIIEAFTQLERQLSSPGRDTRTSPPARAVPYRPQP